MISIHDVQIENVNVKQIGIFNIITNSCIIIAATILLVFNH